jgi:hypothetical protein
MRLFLRSRHRLIGIRGRDDGSVVRYGGRTGDPRVVRVRPFPEPARTTIHRDAHDRLPFLSLRILYMGRFSLESNENFAVVRKVFFGAFIRLEDMEKSLT